MKRIFCLSFTYLILFSTYSQNQLLSVEDAVLKQRTSLAPERLSQLCFVPGSSKIAYVGKSNGKECIIHQDIQTLKRDTILGIDEFKEILKSVNHEADPVSRFPFITWIDQTHFRLYYSNAYYVYSVSDKVIKLLVKAPKSAEDLDYDPVSNRVAFTINNNVCVNDYTQSLQENFEKIYFSDAAGAVNAALTKDGTYGLVNGKSVHRNEFGINKGTFWSPSGNRLAFYKMYENMVTDYPIMDLNAKPAIQKPIKYPMAGATNHIVKVFIHDFAKSSQIEVATGNFVDQYLTNITWAPGDEYLYVAIVNRAQNEMKLNAYDGLTGKFIKTLFTETHSKYVEPEHPMYFVKTKPNLFVWMSERDGYNQLYLYDAKGNLQKQLTKGKYDVTEFLGYNADGTIAFYIAASEDGLNRYCCSVDLKSGKTSVINKTNGVHTATVSADGNFILDTYSNTTTPRTTLLMDKNGKELSMLLNATNPLVNYRPCGVRLSSIPSKDGSVSLNYRMFFPPDFDSTKKYPVLVYVYGGPHAQMITNTWLGAADMWLYYMAQNGYVVFTLDNRGSSNRGLAFEQATFRKFGTIETEDQLTGISFLQSQKYIDTTRVGVFGWSFGGFMSITLKSKTPYFKVAVAGGPVIDWGMYEIMYTERYMDTPKENEQGYKESNLMNYVKGVKGKLMLIHGTDDDVVLWQHSLNYLKTCVDEGVMVDYFVYPGHKHNVLGKDRVHLMKKVAEYFKENL